MECEIDQTPFKMEEMVAKLFNKQFLSDITFMIEDKPIYAHSLILMMRSSVFQKQLNRLHSEKKIISITDYGYEAFYQLIEFIYTDQYDRFTNYHVELLKLAKYYNVVRLLNVLLNEIRFITENLDFCVVENYKIGLNSVILKTANQLNATISSNAFLSIHPDTLEVILKLDHVYTEVEEIDIIVGMVRWMMHYCTENEISFVECRQKFDKLIRLIRFTTLDDEDLNDVKTTYPDFLTDRDYLDIAAQKTDAATKEDDIWNCTPRQIAPWPYKRDQYAKVLEFETVFSVSTDLIFAGFVFGVITSFSKDNRINFTISCQDPKLKKMSQININEVNGDWISGVISLGASIRLVPNIIYTIRYKPTLVEKKKLYSVRTPQTELILTAPPNSVKIIRAHETMIEMLFIKPEDAGKSIDL